MKNFLLLIALTAMYTFASANKVAITNVSIINNGPGAISVQFDLSWDKSWRINVGPANYDGVWVFFKYKAPGGTWTTLGLTGTNNVLPSGFAVYQTSNNYGPNRAGAMIYRDVNNLGVGAVAPTGISLSVINTLPYNVDVRAFAIEMVYVPAPSSFSRSFFGDGNGTTESVNAFHYTDNTATTTSVLPISTDANGFDDYDMSVNGLYVYSNDTIQTINPIGSLQPFPTMKSVWCMKHEINQAAYRDFLNTLTFSQQAARTFSYPSSVQGTKALVDPAGGSYRNGIIIATPGVGATTPAVYGCNLDGDSLNNETTDGEWIACGFLTWPDVAAYLDWSGLAPMTELQFERICRGNTSAGPNAAVLGEYAWGTNTIDINPYNLTTAGTASELAGNASSTLGNAVYSTNYSAGPVRSGMFATAVSTRITSGASFYGVMEMSGNIAEYCITLGNIAGRSTHYFPNGDGTLSVNGNANLPLGSVGYWPGMEGNNYGGATTTCAGPCEVTGNAGIILRGGSFNDSAPRLAVSDRGNLFTPTIRYPYSGGRGVLNIR